MDSLITWSYETQFLINVFGCNDKKFIKFMQNGIIILIVIREKETSNGKSWLINKF